MQKTYAYESKAYRFRIVIIGYILIVIAVALAVLYVLSPTRFIYLFGIAAAVYGALNTFVLKSNPREVVIDDETISFVSFGEARYEIAKLKTFNVREFANAQFYIRVEDTAGKHGRYWVQYYYFNDREELIGELNRQGIHLSEKTIAQAAMLPAAGGATADGVTIAVGGDELSRFAWDIADVPGFVVAGERRTGRSTALAAALAQAGPRMGVIVVALRDGPLRRVATRLALTPLTSPDITPDQFFAVLDAARATSAARGAPGVLAVVDDVELTKDTPVEEALLENRAGLRLAVAAHVDEAAGMFRGLFVEAKKSRFGLLLSPTTPPQGTHCFGAQVPRTMLGAAAPGRGLLFRDGEYLQVHVPLAGDVG